MSEKVGQRIWTGKLNCLLELKLLIRSGRPLGILARRVTSSQVASSLPPFELGGFLVWLDLIDVEPSTCEFQSLKLFFSMVSLIAVGISTVRPYYIKVFINLVTVLCTTLYQIVVFKFLRWNTNGRSQYILVHMSIRFEGPKLCIFLTN